MPIFDVLRHANAPSIQDVDAKHRYLGLKGINQARHLHRDTLAEEINVPLIITSPMIRCITTAIIGCPQAEAPIIECPELFTPDGNDGTIIDEKFGQYQYDFAAYKADGEIWSILVKFGRTAAAKVRKLSANVGEKTTVWVATHAIFANMIAFCLADETEHAGQIVFDVNLGEAERFRVERGVVTHIPLST